VTIYNGVDLNLSIHRDTQPSLRDAYGLSGEDFLIGCAARLEPQKGQIYLIEACGILKEKLGSFHLFLIGDRTDIPYYEKCQGTARSLGIQDRVHFLEHQSNVFSTLQDLDLYVLPSLSEAFPRSVIEALSLSKPVIVTDTGGCAEAVEDQVSGFVVPTRNAAALAERIIEMGMDRDMRVRMGQAARKRVEDFFSLEDNVRQTQSLYLDVLGTKQDDARLKD
jgi:glycosyltransferase involved in cell wall biosynthesis